MGNFLEPEEDRLFFLDINNLLVKLSDRQKAEFSWICAVRSLPFISIYNFGYCHDERFNYYMSDCWNEKNLHNMLFSFLWSLDLSLSKLIDLSGINKQIHEADVYNTTEHLVAHVEYHKMLTKENADAAAYAAQAISYFTHTTFYMENQKNLAEHSSPEGTKKRADIINDSAIVTAKNTRAAFAAYHNSEYKRGYILDRLQGLLYSDINRIYRNEKGFLADFDVYEGRWTGFLDDLNSLGCRYWAKLYNNLFNNNFIIDIERLKLRLKMPDDLKYEGAAVTGKWFEKSEKGVL